MRQMMSAVGKSPGILGRLPGFKQMAQARALKDMNMGDLLPMIPEEDLQEKRKSHRYVDLQKRRRKAKEARKQRKKHKKKKKGKKR